MASGDTTKRKGANTTPKSGNTTQRNGKAKTARAGSIDDKTRARVRKLARAGRSQNSIAREVGIAQSSVKRICDAARPPITFDRSKVAAANEARVFDAKAARAQVAEQAMQRIGKLFDLLDAEHTVIGWYEGVATEHTIKRPTSGDMKNYITSIGILIDKHLVLVRHDSDDRDLPSIDKWIAAMLGGGES